MTVSVSKPPLVAATLLRWMGPRDEAVVGDLLEGYRSGQSRLWYWRQVIAAIVIGALTEVRSHKLAAVRALVVGWIIGWVYFQYVFAWVASALYTVVIFDEFLFVTGLTKWFYQNGVGLPGVLSNVVAPVTICLGWFLNGWMVGYFHRAHGASMVVAYVALFSVMWLVQLSWLMLLRGVDPATVFSLGASAFFYGSVPVLIGGLCGASTAFRPRPRTTASL